MSENLDLVRSIYAVVERGPLSVAKWADPQIEWISVDGPEPVTRIGVADMELGLRDAVNAWTDYRVTVDEYRELDEERILVLIHRSGRGKSSGLDLADVQTQGATLYFIRKGKVAKLVNYLDRRRAFADLGLEE